MSTAMATFRLPLGAAAALTGADRLKSLGDFAAIVLALLTFFSGSRAARLASDTKEGLGRLTRKTWQQMALDGALALFEAAACVAMFSSFTDSISLDRWADRSQALSSMFSLIYIGFVAILIFQISLIIRRFVPSARSSRAGRGKGRSTTPETLDFRRPGQ
jgi:uncharacterized membrane protein